AARCVDTILPQDSGAAAIAAALTCPLPPAGATLAMVNPSMGILGAIALLALRADGVELGDEIVARVREIATPATPWRPGDPVEPVSGPQALLLTAQAVGLKAAARVAPF